MNSPFFIRAIFKMEAAKFQQTSPIMLLYTFSSYEFFPLSRR